MRTLLDVGECHRGHDVHRGGVLVIRRRNGITQYSCRTCHNDRQRAYDTRRRATAQAA